MKTVALLSLLYLLTVVGLLPPTLAQAQATSFTYQGQLRQSGEPFTGTADLEFRLYDQLVSGSQIGSTQSASNWPVEDGLFQVELDFGAAAFDGSDRFLEVTVDGAPLIPRQKVTAAPYALLAAGLAAGSVGGSGIDPTEIQLRVVGTCPAGEYLQQINQDGSVICGVETNSGGTITSIQTGTGLTGGPITETGTISVAPGGIGAAEIDSSQVQARVSGSCAPGLFLQQVNGDGSVACAADAIGSDWRLGGNAGTNPATDFLGTTDATPFEIRTDSARSLRIEPSDVLYDGVPNTATFVAGSRANAVTAGVRGAIISGGGTPEGDDPSFSPTGPNKVTDHFGSVVGGLLNQAGNDDPSLNNASFATVLGGSRNRAVNLGSTVVGGRLNTASGIESIVLGGLSNEASDAYSAVAGGSSNSASGISSFVGGGSGNDASSQMSTVGGGQSNEASGAFSAVSGGDDNSATANLSHVGGGGSNRANSVGSAILGGLNNEATGPNSTVGGGQLNDSSGESTTVGGGAGNEASGAFSTVSGGEVNSSSRFYSTVGGGRSNTASGNSSTVAGGLNNEASGIQSAVGGGTGNCAGGTSSWAGGFRAKVRPGTLSGAPVSACLDVPISGGAGDQGTFIWADTTVLEGLTSTGPNQFLVRASGGVGFGTNAPQAQLHVTESVNANANNSSAHVAIIENVSTDTSTGPDVLAVKTSMVDPDLSANLITFFDGNDDAIGRIEGDALGGITFNSGGADFAEWLPKRNRNDELEPGDVVGWHADGISHDTEGALRLMVVSTQPIVAGNAPDEADLDAWARVGFIGQVPVRVIGPVEAGDWIVASGRGDGTARAFDSETAAPKQFAHMIGQALESNDLDGEHRVNVAIGLDAHQVFGQTMARMQARNTRLQARLDVVEARHEARLDALHRQQEQELTAMRQELALLRQLVAPDTEPSLAQESKR